MFIPLHDGNALRHIRLQYVTLAIIALNVLAWLSYGPASYGRIEVERAAFLTWGYIPAVANGYAALPADFVLLPQWTKAVSYAFLHGDIFHLGGNMLFLWVFGDNVEDALGHIKYAIFFILCAIAGAMMHSLVEPQSQAPLVGASGAAAGVVAAYLMLHPKIKLWVLALGKFPIRLSAMWVIGAWIAFQFGNFAFNAGDNVSWGAHVGGILAGAILLPLMKRRGVVMFDRNVASPVTAPKGATSVEATAILVDEPKSEPRSQSQPESRAWGRQGDGA